MKNMKSIYNFVYMMKYYNNKFIQKIIVFCINIVKIFTKNMYWKLKTFGWDYNAEILCKYNILQTVLTIRFLIL